MVVRVRLGELLIAEKIISEDQLLQAIAYQKKTGEKIGQALVSLGFITDQQFLNFFSQQLNIPFYDLKQYKINPDIASIIPESYARLYRAIILEKKDDGFLVGMSDPLDVVATNKLRQLLQKPVSFALVKEKELEHVFNLVYRRTQEISSYAQALSKEVGYEQLKAPTAATATSIQADAPVTKLLDSMFKDAVQMNASDIHIEPGQHDIRIRLRIDGMLHDQILKDPSIMPAIASRLKLSGGLDIAEKRLPQDGRFEMTALDKRFDIRLSTMPTPFGESIVMRLLKQTGGILSLEQTGMQGSILKRFREICHKPNGIVIVTGPTGSGKSTTLYAALNEINNPEIKMITIEDPIEYFLARSIQIQTNDQIGLTFANILRGILRHDPDVILVGEMRDKETAEIAMRTALTGRLVLTTLHTNDAASAIYRLIDLGVEGYIIAATTQAILAQRLVRLICPHCITDAPLDPQETIWLEKQGYQTQSITFKCGKGCSYCGNTGYHGRIAIFELLEFNTQMGEALRQNNPQLFYDEAKKSTKGFMLIDDAYRLAVEGKTTVSEMMRVINEA